MAASVKSGLRRARKEDAEALARLIDIAGEGIPSWLWGQLAPEGYRPIDIGIERAQRETGSFSYRNVFVLEHGGKVAGMLLGYRLSDPVETGDLDELPAPVRPLAELEAQAPGTWYINAVAIFPEFQGKGFGSRLLRLAETLARNNELKAMSLIVARENRGAALLYERMGFDPVAERPIVPYPGGEYVGGWVLMIKSIDGETDNK